METSNQCRVRIVRWKSIIPRDGYHRRFEYDMLGIRRSASWLAAWQDPPRDATASIWLLWCSRLSHPYSVSSCKPYIIQINIFLETRKVNKNRTIHDAAATPYCIGSGVLDDIRSIAVPELHSTVERPELMYTAIPREAQAERGERWIRALWQGFRKEYAVLDILDWIVSATIDLVQDWHGIYTLSI